MPRTDLPRRERSAHIMKASLRFAAALLAAVAALPCAASESGDVAKLLAEKRCNACHDTKATLLGPPYVAIAIRHRANAEEMTEVLARKIIVGGGGSWGAVPMVPNEHVTLEEARAMARWILALE